MTAQLVIYGAGHRDPVPLDPAAMTFRAQTAKNGCHGCAFDGQWYRVCKRAGELAKAAGLADCDDGVIYVAADSRQLDLLSGATAGATVEAPDQNKTY